MRSALSIPFFAILFLVGPGNDLRADSPLEKQMNQMRRSFKELKKAMEAPVEADKPKYLGWVADLKKASEEAKAMEPEKTEKVPAEEQKAFLEGYRSKMEESIELTDELGKAIEAGKWAEAKGLIGQISQVQREGHKKYRAEEH
jgi:soluble cytochrome b562